MGIILSGNTAKDDRNTHWKHALETCSQRTRRLTTPGESFAVKFVIMKHSA